MTNQAVGVIGIDVSKAHLDVAAEQGAAQRLANNAEGHELLLAWLGRAAPSLVVLEATGGYKAPVVAALASAGLPVVVVNPRQVRDFARAVGILGPV